LSSITVELQPEQFAQFQCTAERLGVSIEDPARSSIEALLAGSGDKFERASEAVLQKNKELYKRLA
jgi:hypothetical protein